MGWEGHKKDKKDIGATTERDADLAWLWLLLLLYRGISLSCSSLPPSKLIMVLLVTSDNEQFVVEKDVAERSVLIKNMLEGNSSTLSS